MGVFDAIGTVGAAAVNYAATQKSADAQMKMARENIAAEDARLAKQREEALADRAHAEQYNSPLMERLRREVAGLAPVDDYSTPGTPAEGLVPDYSKSIQDHGQALVAAAGLGASSPMVMMQGALHAAKTMAEIRKDNSVAADQSASAKVRDLNAELLKETFEDQVLKAKLDNNYLYEQTNKTIEEANDLISSRDLKKAERRAVLQNMRFAAELQQWRVKQAKAEAELSENHVKITQYQLDELLPAELKEIKARTSELNARADLSRSEKRRIDTLLPLESRQMQEYITALSIANSDATLAHDENIVKHNKFMSHLKEYEDALVAKYNLDAKTAHWYATNQFINIGSEIVGAGIKIYGLSKFAGAAGSAAAKMAAPVLYLPGTSQFEKMAGSFGNSTPPLVM